MAQLASFRQLGDRHLPLADRFPIRVFFRCLNGLPEMRPPLESSLEQSGLPA